MPASIPPVRPHPGKPFRTLKHAGRDHQVVTLRCNLCHRKRHYLASDLADIVGPDWPTHHAPFPCPEHGREFVSIKVWSPKAEDIGKVPIRRPAKVIQTWKTVMLGD